MRTFIAVVALALSAIFAGSLVAEANTCPLLVKQLREAKIDDPKKAAEVKKLTDEAEKLHQAGKHADSVAKCQEAAKVAGIELKMKQ
jgi:hypothetical protein